jgi:hypothetical protein
MKATAALVAISCIFMYQPQKCGFLLDNISIIMEI